MVADEIEALDFARGDVLYVCSAGLENDSVRATNQRAMEYAARARMLIFLDLQSRAHSEAGAGDRVSVLRTMVTFAHILKIDRKALRRIAQEDDDRRAAGTLFAGNLRAIVVPDGANGCAAYFADGTRCLVPSEPVLEPIDKDRAADCFAGTLLYQLLQQRRPARDLPGRKEEFEKYLRYAQKAAGLCVFRRDADGGFPTRGEVFAP